MRVDPAIARRVSLIAFLVSGVLIYLVDQSSYSESWVAWSYILWGVLLTVAILYSVFVDGDWKQRPFLSFDYWVPALGRVIILFSMARLFPGWWSFVAAVVIAMIIATFDVWIVPLLRRLLLR